MVNKLALETSPYLLQHKDNPVDWHPWGKEAFDLAARLEKPIFLSIGYATCYWCHVMEKDSFEEQNVAEILNRYFIPVKVDREERPDVDSLYMDAVMGLTGHGGWPMSVFLTPDLKPFWAGTFVKQDQLICLMQKLAEIWNEDRTKIIESADSIAHSLKPKQIAPLENFNSIETIKRAAEALLRNYDSQYGGFGPAPKFPPHQQIALLTLASGLTNDSRYDYAAQSTLEKIAKSGLMDHLEGGFHRYATDAAWEIPHFEKMLYDQALLIISYLDGFERSGFEPFLQVAEKTAQYVFSVMASPDGGYFSAEDAGEVNKEGEFYVWSYDELSSLSEELFQKLNSIFALSKEGNFEGNNTLIAKDINKLFEVDTQMILKNLRIHRDSRARPAKDTKVITSWNGLFLSALARLGRASSNFIFLQKAKDLAAFLPKVRGDLSLSHIAQSSRSLPAIAEDYAYTVQGLIEMYQTTFDEDYLAIAYKLQHEQLSRLWDSEAGLFRSSDALELISQRYEVTDGALPSTNSISMRNCIFLSKAYADAKLYSVASSIQQRIAEVSHKYPTATLSFLVGSVRYERELVIIAESLALATQTLSELRNAHSLSQFALFIGVRASKSQVPAVEHKRESPDPQNSITVYLCTAGACLAPTHSVAECLEQLTIKTASNSSIISA